MASYIPKRDARAKSAHDEGGDSPPAERDARDEVNVRGRRSRNRVLRVMKEGNPVYGRRVSGNDAAQSTVVFPLR
jgi:hypothetical protein